MSSDTQSYQPLPGSERTVAAGARRIRAADPAERVDVSVVLRRRGDADRAASSTPGERAKVEGRLGADPDDVAAVERFAHAHGLTVTGVNIAARSVGLAGSVAAMNDAFRVELGEYRHAERTYRGREGQIQVPEALAGRVRAVFGLDERPQARAHFRVAAPGVQNGAAVPALRPRAPAASAHGFAPEEVGRLYAFPSGVDGTGQTIAVIELGGGYSPDDLNTYFAQQGRPTPSITAVSVDGAHNQLDGSSDGEVALDIEIIGRLAPGASQAVYFAPNTTRGFYDAVAAAIHDTHRQPSVISISWGGPEPSWTAQAMDAYNELFADAATLNITVFCAAGDDGASDGVQGGQRYVDFPASSPNVVACGGTRLTNTSETVWNGLATGNGATGGGVSRHFDRPSYQDGVSVPPNPVGAAGRGVPDVAGDADPATGYLVRYDGQDTVVGGTSAVAPLWAGLTALVNQANGHPAGDIHQAIYQAGRSAFVDITDGDNDGYQAGPGWDPCTGLGRPIGDQIAQVLAAP